MEKFKKYSFRKELKKICNKNADKVCIHDDIKNEKILYADLYKNLFSIQNFLKKKGIKKETLIVSCLENSSMNFQIFLSLMFFGYTYSPLTPDTTIEEFKKSLKISKNFFVLVSNGTNNSLMQYLKKNKIKFLNINNIKPNSKQNFFKIRSSNVIGRLILNSSGTTGNPKKSLLK